MDRHQIDIPVLGLKGYHFASPQRSGALTVLPLFGREHTGRFAPPLSGLKLAGVKGYGNITLENAMDGVAIVPLHIGYIQDQAQNHALCRSAFIGPGQKLLFKDACCVQQAQGGYLEGKEQWFFILPIELREEALRLRGKENYQKLWKAISAVNQKFGKESRGHLEDLICRERPYLTQYQSRFELLPGQTGALFFFRDTLIGIEIAPNASYFAELWPALICFCYGPFSMYHERQRVRREAEKPTPVAPLLAESLQALREKLLQSRKETLQRLLKSLQSLSEERLSRTEEERYLTLRLSTVEGKRFIGQIVEEKEQICYASLTARAQSLSEAEKAA